MPTSETIFWHPCKTFTIGNYVKEKKSAGNIDQMEGELVFSDHVYVATTAKDVKFIKNSREFKNGIIQECETMARAMALTKGHNYKKSRTLEDVTEPLAPVDEKVTNEVSATG